MKFSILYLFGRRFTPLQTINKPNRPAKCKECNWCTNLTMHFKSCNSMGQNSCLKCFDLYFEFSYCAHISIIHICVLMLGVSFQ